jgi:hypothetical protein
MLRRLKQFHSKIKFPIRNFSQAQATYSNWLIKYPLLTKSITSGFIAFCGDIACQTLQTRDIRKNDYLRTCKFTLLGCVFIGPSLHIWYGFLAKAFPNSGLLSVFQRLACDQFIFAPFMVSSMLSSVLIMDGKSNQISTKLKSQFFTTLMANYVVWIPAMFINFRFVPGMYQVCQQ